MINWDKELERIFADPLLADVVAPVKKVTSSDRLIAGFQHIMDFVETNGRLPQKDGEREERTLYNQLRGICADEKKKERCRPYDTAGILKESEQTCLNEPKSSYQTHSRTESESLDDIFNDPIFADVTSETSSLFELPDYMKKKQEERKEADYVAKRVPCKDFELFEPGFKAIHAGLQSGTCQLIKFKDQHIAPGHYYVEDGILVYLAALDKVQKNKYGKKESRTRCIYENGLESGIYLQTLCKNLYTTGYTVRDVSKMDMDYLKRQFEITDRDVESGVIYVLRSLSKNPAIASISNLYKIGFTTTSLETRIANARNEPTYLCADVQVVASWKVYNVKSSVFESLIHKLFHEVQLQVTVDGKMPKEWYQVPLSVIERAVMFLVHGKPIAYDKNMQQLVDLSE